MDFFTIGSVAARFASILPYQIFKLRIENIVELDAAVSDSRLTILDLDFLELGKIAVIIAERQHIGFLAHEHVSSVAPVADGVDAPCRHAFVEHLVEIVRIIFLAVFLLEIPVSERQCSVLGNRL